MGQRQRLLCELARAPKPRPPARWSAHVQLGTRKSRWTFLDKRANPLFGIVTLGEPHLDRSKLRDGSPRALFERP
jgi:hypothetical protein